MPNDPQGPRLTWLGQLFVLLFIGACGFGAWALFLKKPINADPSAPAQPSKSFFGGGDGAPVEIVTARVRAFEDEGVPVDAYGVGGSVQDGRWDFTADVVRLEGAPQAKQGRALRPNGRMEKVK